MPGVGRGLHTEPSTGPVFDVLRPHYSQIATHLKERVNVTEAWLSTQAWQRYPCGSGSKGERYYDWARVTIIGKC